MDFPPPLHYVIVGIADLILQINTTNIFNRKPIIVQTEIEKPGKGEAGMLLQYVQLD